MKTSFGNSAVRLAGTIAAAWLLSAQTTLAATPPAAPTSLTATVVSLNQITLYWQDGSSSTSGSLIIERKNGSAAYSQIAVLGGSFLAYYDVGLAAGISYTYRIRGYNAGTYSAYSNEASATITTPAPPTQLAATAVSATQINITWKATASAINSYCIERKIAGGSYAQIGVTGVTGLTYSDTGLVPGSTYTYRVRDEKIGIFSSYSNEATATTSPYVAVTAPTNLTAKAISSDQINLSWKSGGGAVAGFSIEGKLANGRYCQIATVGAAATTYSNFGNAPYTTYVYRIRAYYAGNYSPYSNEATVTTPAPAPPAPPANLFAASQSVSQINLSWTGCLVSVTNYLIERKSGSGSFAQVATTTDTQWTYVDKGLAAGTTYTYRVRALISGKYTDYSNTVSVNTYPAPTAPTGLKATVASGTQINLSWNAGAGCIGGYAIERKIGTAAYVQIATVDFTVLSYKNTGLVANTAYTYRVRGYNSGLYSGYSNEVTATPKALKKSLAVIEADHSIQSSLAPKQVTIIDGRGSCIARTTIFTSSAVETQLVPMHLAPGFYIVRIFDKTGVTQQRMTVRGHEIDLFGN